MWPFKQRAKKLNRKQRRSVPYGRRSQGGLGLEALESREMMTIGFTPVFGAEPLTSANKEGMHSPPVFLDFLGSYWNTAAGQADKTYLQNEAASILGGPYLSALTNYGSDGKAFFDAAYVHGSNPTTISQSAEPTSDQIRAELQGVIADPKTPLIRPDKLPNSPIYVVITDPAHSNGNGGWNVPSTYSYTGAGGRKITNMMHEVWIGTRTAGVTTVNKDIFGSTFSHEIAETISDPDHKGIHVGFGQNLPPYLQGDNQIGDNEPAPAGEAHYGYRLNGYEVQPYWMANAGAFIVPDGNKQIFTLNPQWGTKTVVSKTSISTVRTFNSQQYALTINGDQLYNRNVGVASTNDVITIDATPSGGIKVTENGETATFDPGVITSITVNGGQGADTINVERLVSTVPLTINLGNGSDVVNLSPTAQSLDNLQGSLTIHAGTGSGALNVYDQKTNDVILRRVNQVAYNLSAGELYRSDSASSPPSGSTSFYSTDVHFAGIAAINIYGANSSSDYNITGADGIALQVFAGAGTDQLTFDDRGGSFNLGATYTMNAGVVTRQGTHFVPSRAPLIYNTNIRYTGIDSVNVIGNSADSSYNIVGTAANVPLRVQTGNATNQIAIGDTQGTLNSLLAPVQVVGGYGTNSLAVNDRGSVNGPLFFKTIDFTLTETSLIRDWSAYSTLTHKSTQYPSARIDWTNLTSITVNGGATGNTFNVQSLPYGSDVTLNGGAGDDTFNLGDASGTLNGIGTSLTIHGEEGENVLNLNDQGTTTGEVYGVTATTITRTDFARTTIDFTVNYDGLSGLNLLSASGADNYVEFDVSGTAAGTTTQLTGEAGYVWYLVEDFNGTLDGIQGALNLESLGTYNYYGIADTDNLVSHTYRITSPSFGSESFKRLDSDGQDDMAPITLVGNGTIEFNGSYYAPNEIDVLGSAMGFVTELFAQSGDLVTLGAVSHVDPSGTMKLQGKVGIGAVATNAPVVELIGEVVDSLFGDNNVEWYMPDTKTIVSG